MRKSFPTGGHRWARRRQIRYAGLRHHAHPLRARSRPPDSVRLSALRALVWHVPPRVPIVRRARPRVHAPPGPAGGDRLPAGALGRALRRRELAAGDRRRLSLGRRGIRVGHAHPAAADPRRHLACARARPSGRHRRSLGLRLPRVLSGRRPAAHRRARRRHRPRHRIPRSASRPPRAPAPLRDGRAAAAHAVPDAGLRAHPPARVLHRQPPAAARTRASSATSPRCTGGIRA